MNILAFIEKTMLNDLLALIGINERPANYDHIKEISFGLNYENRRFLNDFILSSNMPQAVDPTLIVKSDDDTRIRAKNIINYMIKEDISSRKFIDYGCGRGFCVGAASEKTAKAFGYDVTLSPNRSMITSSREYIKECAPYDVMLVYDVIDHIRAKDLNYNIDFIKSIITKNSRIYVRVHPYTSRHGAHSYMTHNKAFLHLFIDSNVAAENKVMIDNALLVKDPKNYYDNLFRSHGFDVISKDLIMTPVESIFRYLIPFISDYGSVEQYMEAMSIDFIDYVLSLA
jgi:hypothetical protein